MNQKEYYGTKSIENLKIILNQVKPKSIFLVTGKRSYSHHENKLKSMLLNYKYTRFYNFEVNPKIEDVEKGVEIIKREKCDFVICIGGGSVLDIGKIINILSKQKEEPSKYIKKELNLEKRGNKLIAIPTTAGTGSEATHFATVYINKTKYSLSNNFILPDYVILDPELTFSLPKRETACTGIDALSQAIESYWNINSTEESKRYAKKSIRLVMNNLIEAVKSPSKKSRSLMMLGSNLAGKAINITKTTAPHAISYPMTIHFNIPHGHAVALSLPGILLHNSLITEETNLDPRGANYVKKTLKEIFGLLEVKSAEEAKIKLNSLIKEIGLETTLKELGINNIEVISKEGLNPERVKNNPTIVTEDTIKKILE